MFLNNKLNFISLFIFFFLHLSRHHFEHILFEKIACNSISGIMRLAWQRAVPRFGCGILLQIVAQMFFWFNLWSSPQLFERISTRSPSCSDPCIFYDQVFDIYRLTWSPDRPEHWHWTNPVEQPDRPAPRILDAVHDLDLNLDSWLLLQAALEVRSYALIGTHRCKHFDTSTLLSAISLCSQIYSVYYVWTCLLISLLICDD